jgi:hypothetical protein
MKARSYKKEGEEIKKVMMDLRQEKITGDLSEKVIA